MMSGLAHLWTLDPSVTFLNHGSFGACPAEVLNFQAALRAQMERQPVLFLARELEGLLDEARRAVAAFVGAVPENLVFTTNATTGVNTILRALDFSPQDELLVTDHEYGACRAALDFVARRSGASIKVAKIPFPLSSSDQVIECVLAQVTRRTRLALLDHITSPTALVLPIERLVTELNDRGIDTLVDGAHAPGMVALDLKALNAAYYTGNCHKWLCGPKSAAFLHVRPDRQEHIHPLSISHGFNSPRKNRARFLLEFDWTGTADPTPILCVPEAIRYLSTLLPGGWPALYNHNRNLALKAQSLLCQTLGIKPPCPSECMGAMASFPLPLAIKADLPQTETFPTALQEKLWLRHRIELPVLSWPEAPGRLLRISCQLYNAIEQYQFLAQVLPQLLAEEN